MKIKLWIEENEQTILKSFKLSIDQTNELINSKNILSNALKWEELNLI